MELPGPRCSFELRPASLDTSFDPGVGFTQDVLTIVPVDRGKYMVGGIFTTASGLLAKSHCKAS
jgi:hypothetical protein